MLRAIQIQGQVAYDQPARDVDKGINQPLGLDSAAAYNLVPAGTAIQVFQLKGQVAYSPRPKRVAYTQASPWGCINQVKYRLVETWH